MDVVRGTLKPLSGVSEYFVSLPLQPVFNIVHFLLTAIALRNEPGGLQFSRQHPVASCVMTFLVASSGGLLASLTLGQAPADSILNPVIVATCAFAWYVIFFSPSDIMYKFCLFTPVSLVLWVIKELSRAKKVYNGVQAASSLYPDSILVMTLVGMFKGSGKQWGITWYHLVFSPQSARRLELLGISYTTKSALALGLLLAYNHTQSLLDPAPLVLLGGCIFVGFKLWNLRVRNVDPFLASQGILWNVLTYFSMRHPQPMEGGAVVGGVEKSVGVGGAEESVTEESVAKTESQSSGHSSDTVENRESVEHLKHE